MSGPSWTTGKTENWCFERGVAFHTSGSKPKTHTVGKTGNRSMFAKLYLFRLGYGPSFRLGPPDQNQCMSPRCFLGWWFLSNIKNQLRLWTQRAWGPPLWGTARPWKARALLHSFFSLQHFSVLVGLIRWSFSCWSCHVTSVFEIAISRILINAANMKSPFWAF